MRVVWTEEYTEDYSNNLEWLEKEFGSAQVIKFDMQVEGYIQSIKENPYAFPIFNDDSKVRRCVVHPKTTIIYLIDEKMQTLTLLRFWGNLRDPESYEK